VTVEIDVVYEGGLHTRAVHGPSGAELATDAPKDNEGLGEAFSPTDLLAAALGSCTLTVMGIVARRRGWSMEGARAHVKKQMVVDPVRRVGRLAVDLYMPALPEDARPILERTALICPVHKSLHPEVVVELRFLWGEEA
jgi:putative redox protein